uniref:Uncharacterized protein n=1 Tax=Anguilla anguilla TaxID=7936 RepID=A0A0E9TXA0_ANGAN
MLCLCFHTNETHFIPNKRLRLKQSHSQIDQIMYQLARQS